MRRSRVFLLLLLLSFSALTVHAQEEPTKQTFFLTFIPNIQFSPVYVALENGDFTAANIEVELEYSDEPLGVDLIAANERQFGLISAEEVIKARANGRPVVQVYEWFQKYPIGIVVSDSSGIESVADLKGRKVGVPGRFGASYNGLTALLTANGLTEADIALEAIGYNAPDVFCVGGVEAAVVYINNEPLQIQQRADEGNCNGVTGLRVFPVSDAVDMVSNGLLTNEQTIAENPELVSGMIAAFDAGLRTTINNPAEAYLISAKYVENLPMSDELKAALETAAAAQDEFLAANPDRAAIAESRAALLADLQETFDSATLIQFEVLLNTIDLWDADQLGLADTASWEATQSVLVDMKFVTTPIDMTTAFTNSFLPTVGR
ncbi:MAG: ABC transporter substrate-binding protein [Anaerolineae bacterium]|nr:ABC transporter substrate-binding protein [Anaerolineae bacterium]